MINGLALANVMIIKKVDLPAQACNEQKNHLTSASGIQFVEASTFYAQKLFEADMVHLVDGQVPMEVVANKEFPNTIPVEVEVVGTKATLEQRLDDMENNIETRIYNDSLVERSWIFWQM